ncbi:MAG TPA: vWA domain-containing protein [Pirellulales bacterium]|jgi:Ca-activated chloride channel family protein|nr:vWA domain-containing protein [Pirellulales bacterium]
MVALTTAALVMLAGAGAEWLHARRTKRVARLAFGPTGAPAVWARVAPLVRVAAQGAFCWGVVTLLLLPPRVHRSGEVPPHERRHLLLVLDVSPSMKLQDAGPSGEQGRAQRVANLLESFFMRIPLERYRTTIVATYTEAKPVVVATSDLEVVRNILEDLPMQFAFQAGSTDLFAGLREAARLAQPWNPRSTTLMVFSDGDTVPAAGMPALPPSIDHVLVVGVGDPVAGRFIDGHMSRQDVSTLQQLAVRLRGHYHNGNARHLGTDLVRLVAFGESTNLVQRLTRREYALLATIVGASALAVLPWLLAVAGTHWTPGTRRDTSRPRPRRELVEVRR